MSLQHNFIHYYFFPAYLLDIALYTPRSFAKLYFRYRLYKSPKLILKNSTKNSHILEMV